MPPPQLSTINAIDVPALPSLHPAFVVPVPCPSHPFSSPAASQVPARLTSSHCRRQHTILFLVDATRACHFD